MAIAESGSFSATLTVLRPSLSPSIASRANPLSRVRSPPALSNPAVIECQPNRSSSSGDDCWAARRQMTRRPLKVRRRFEIQIDGGGGGEEAMALRGAEGAAPEESLGAPPARVLFGLVVAARFSSVVASASE
ncbi:hypothetical protein QR680_009006 [Steinernema hermaphroditum]|uniref:Uncharacterized protein n=1 Tax=Steinernema hermaphroditum TaxID=289476 RepID=A0AA39IL17_9BILA|nr:hypothetical protein QR680_009006 [Steinernema hermaphroditum]